MSVVDAYFAASEHPYWQWQDDGRVVGWSDGQTVAFRAELATVYRRLQTQSLPPFGAVVLLMAACRDSWNEAPSRIGLLSGLLATGKRMDRLELLNRVAARLDQVRALDAKLRTPPEAKAELVAMVFEGQGEPPLPGTYERLIADLEGGLGEAFARPQRQQVAVDRLLRDLAWLDKGLDRVDGPSLLLRLRTGLEQPLAPPIEIELPSTGLARQLLSDLKDDPELGGVARLAKLLMAAVHLPTPLSLPEELPLGGVSDISNRGSLDRLLLSELANDGLTLAVRVSMNEALYLRRETPPRPPARRRLVLLDAGLRMWGVPRVFATAVGLALAAGAVDGIDVVVYRAEGRDLLEVDMTAAEGLNAHLAALEHRIHPGEALATLAAEAEAAGDTTDVVLVTGDDVYADRTFQRALSEAKFPALHVATLGRDGSFQLHLQTRRGRKLLRQAQFSLDDVLRPPTKPTTKLIDDAKFELPAIFRVEPFPLFLSHPVDAERSWHVHEFGALTYTRDGRLLHWTDAQHGAQQIAEDLPLGNLHWAATRAQHGEILAIIGKLSRNGLHLIAVSSDGSRCDHVPLAIEIEQPTYAFVHQGVVFVGDTTKIVACSQATGQLMATKRLPPLTHVRSRFSLDHELKSRFKVWLAASFNGTEIVFTEFHRERLEQQSTLTVFDTDDFEGPFCVSDKGMLLDAGTAKTRPLAVYSMREKLKLVGIARNGKRLSVVRQGSNYQEVVDVKSGAIKSIPLEAELFETAKPVVLRHRFSAIGVDVEGRLTLVGRRDTLWPLTYTKQDGTLRLPSQPAATSLRVRHAFESIDESSGRHYSLAVAKFADGSRAVLDGRGLLHLKSSEASLPEMTIVLVEGATAGWLSTGDVWGSAYFVGEEAVLSDGHVMRSALQPFTELLA